MTTPERSIASMLGELPLFATLPTMDREQLAATARECHFAQGSTVFAEGDTAHGMHMVVRGLIKIVHNTPDGQEVMLHIIRPGNACGEAAVFQRSTYPADAVTLEQTSTLYLPAAPLLRHITENPELALRMLAALSIRLRMFAKKLTVQSQSKAARRVALYIAHRSSMSPDAAHIHMDITRETLGSLLGITRETLSRELSALVHDGIIRLQGRTLHIVDMPRLMTLTGEAPPQCPPAVQALQVPDGLQHME